MTQQTTTEDRRTSSYTAGHESFMTLKQIEAVKSAARIEDYARELTELRFNGNSLRGTCPIHKGENRSSFAVYPDKQRWFCYRCNVGGDIVDLCMAAEKHLEFWTAMLSLARRYSIDLPERPRSWYRRQAEKSKVREQVLDVLTDSYQRRFFRIYGDVILEGIEDEEERESEARKLYAGFRRVARNAARGRMERRYA